MATTKLWISEWFLTLYGRGESAGMQQGNKHISRAKDKKNKITEQTICYTIQGKKKKEDSNF